MLNKLPIVFSKHYDITLWGLQKLHPFDSEKYGKVYRYLVQQLGGDRFYTPDIVSEEDLLLVHSREYLYSLKQSSTVASIAEMDILSLLPNFILQRQLLDPVRYATGGTILGSELALEYGWAINLAGGYHHAKADLGGGFCFFADIPIAVYRLFKQQPDLVVLVIDLDAHQGNGYETIFKDDARVYVFDVYNEQIYPGDEAAKKYIEFNFPVQPYIRDPAYLALLEREIGRVIAAAQPNLIIYNAGADIFAEDVMGGLRISEAGIIRRDEIIFSHAFAHKIPILMVLSGGYHQKSVTITGRSIVNVLKQVV